jgi:hypothetical protein
MPILRIYRQCGLLGRARHYGKRESEMTRLDPDPRLSRIRSLACLFDAAVVIAFVVLLVLAFYGASDTWHALVRILTAGG